jgi:hypothetical protein
VLIESVLVNAKLVWAKLPRAILLDANFAGADLSQAELADVKQDAGWGLTQEQLDRAFGDEGTTIPDTLSRPTRWHRHDRRNLQSSQRSRSKGQPAS